MSFFDSGRGGRVGRSVCGCLAVATFGLGCSDDSSGTGAGGASTGQTTSTTSTATTVSSSSGATTSGSGGAGGAFGLEVHTEMQGANLVLRVNLPAERAACLAADVPSMPCDDADADGLVDVWEDAALDRLRPFVVLDEDEQLVADPGFATGIVGRVAPVAGSIHVYMMLGYAKDFGSCGGFTGHNGDSERVALKLDPVPGGGDGDRQVTAAYTAAHEGTASDHSRLFVGNELSMLSFNTDPALGEPRWSVYSSANKHATYGSLSICEGISIIPCFDEDCGPDGVDPAAYIRLFAYLNAGEEGAPLANDLSSLSFAGDDAWAMQNFCGGLGGTGCSAPVREKLLVNPF